MSELAWQMRSDLRVYAALVDKSYRDARLLWVSLALLMGGFNWLFVYLTSTIDMSAFEGILRLLPGWFEQIVGMPVAQVATPAGRIVLAYVDPVIVFSIAAWSLTRGSDAVSGELGRGTLEFVLAQPVTRAQVLAAHLLVNTLGAALLAIVAWCGTALGLATIKLPGDVAASAFTPAAINLFALAFMLSGLATLVSACDQFRWRSIGVVAGVYLVSLILKMVARLVPSLGWLRRLSVLSGYEPQVLVAEQVPVAQAWLYYHGPLFLLGGAAYVLAFLAFRRRDLPATS